MDAETESFVLLLLGDGNLPTGSFVASSGFEAYMKHGFSTLASAAPSQPPKELQPPPKTSTTINFVRDSVQSYAHSTLPFIRAVYDQCEAVRRVTSRDSTNLTLESALHATKDLDTLYEASTLNHIARRASTTQGVALLTLLSKGLVRPSWAVELDTGDNAAGISRIELLAEALKLDIRRGVAHGHLPICWAVLTAALDLSCTRSQQLFLFLHARSLISASIRLNTIGPYAAQQLLLHIVRPSIDATMKEAELVKIRANDSKDASTADIEVDDWTDDGPASTWPLGEILAARHDFQHSRIFNS